MIKAVYYGRCVSYTYILTIFYIWREAMKHISKCIEEYMNRDELKKFVKDMSNEKEDTFYIEFRMPEAGTIAEGQIHEVKFDGDWNRIKSLVTLCVLQGWPIAEG